MRSPLVLAALLSLTVIGCSRAPGSISVALVPADSSAAGHVRVSGLSSQETGALTSANLSESDWQRILAVRVAGGDASSPPVAGRYRVSGAFVEFTPRFTFDPGREYAVTFDPARLPRPRSAPSSSLVVSLPKLVREPTTVVTHIWPSAGALPENLLRIYIEFSGPMSRSGGVEFVALLDERGRPIEDPFLPLDIDFWSPDHTRYTVFFDPARIKRGMHSEEPAGRVLVPGRRYTIRINPRWPDEHGVPLAAPFEHSFLVGPADDRPIDVAAWRVEAPSSDGRGPLAVVFPETLDHGLLSRAMGVVRRDGTPVKGSVRIEANETRWLFVPDEPWRAGDYDVIALSILEDVAGNQIGRAFEVDMFERIDRTSQPEQTKLPFTVK
jgi:hypothetical protein